MKRILTVGASLMLLVMPAHAAAANPTPPAGDKLFEVSCYHLANDHQLHSLNVRAGTRTPIGDGVGTGDTGSPCATQGAVKPGTDWLYYTDGHSHGLFRVNLVSGEVESIGEVLFDGSRVNLISLAIDDSGNAYGLTENLLYSLNLSTATLSTEKQSDVFASTGGYPFGFAFDPRTGEFYVVESVNGGLYRLGIDTGELTLLATNTDVVVGSMAFDSSGRLWVNGDDFGVASVTLGNFGNTGRWYDTGDLSPIVYSNSLAIRRPQSSGNENLANTGAVEIAPLVIVGLGAAVLAFAIRRRSA